MNIGLKGFFFLLAGCIAIALSVSCKGPVNTVKDPHFDEAGYCLDTAKTIFTASAPSELLFYVEVSGSMNGFFRSNQVSNFKKDVWSIVSLWSENNVFVLSNNGTATDTYPVSLFRTMMNQGRFVSAQETNVPTMIKTILSNLDYQNGQCAVLISDMKYSPQNQKDIQVLLAQYKSDIRNLIGKYPDIAACMIMATSQYLAANGSTIEQESPYYYVILGKDENVANIRNCIATLLKDSGNYRESIEMGFDYKSPSYSFGIPTNARRLNNAPTFLGYDTEFSDTCTVVLKLDLSDFRWTIAEKEVLREHLRVKTRYGSGVSVGDISIEDTTNRYNKNFERKVIATVKLKIYNMTATQSDVIEWTLNHPDQLVSDSFMRIISCSTESNPSGSFSVDRFIAGVFDATKNDWDKSPNRILLSKTQ